MSAQVPPFAVQAGEGKSVEAPTGDRATIKAHTRNTNGSMSVIGRLLVITTPSGLERFFEQFAEAADGEALAEVGIANWIEFVGPPRAVSDPV